MPNQNQQPEDNQPKDTAGTDGIDYKALWEQAKADAEKWKAQSRKQESRAKTNAEAAKDLDQVNQQMEEHVSPPIFQQIRSIEVSARVTTSPAP